MVIISVDYGDKRTGVAVCDKYETIASPVKVIDEWNQDALAEKIAAVILEYKAETVVVGLPKNMDGTEGARAEKCRNFAKLLEEKSGVKSFLCDERLTTVISHRDLSVTNTRGKKRKAAVDALSAVIILEDFIETRKNIKKN